MWTRVKTAIILVLIVGVALFASDIPYLFIALLALGVTIAAHEWTKMMPSWKTPLAYVASVLLITLLSLGLSFIWLHADLIWLAWWIVALLVWIMAIGWVTRYPKISGWYGRRLALIGIVMLTAAITAMFYLYQQSPYWLLYVFILVWCADSGAYFVGRKLGKHKMSPKVSPNKSIEGLIGGLVTGLIVVIGISLYRLNLSGFSLMAFVTLSAITIIVSVFGDLFESMLKRHAGIKDSGDILPGHGGVLDRIDSLLAATPIFALGFWLLQHYDVLIIN